MIEWNKCDVDMSWDSNSHSVLQLESKTIWKSRRIRVLLVPASKGTSQFMTYPIGNLYIFVGNWSWFDGKAGVFHILYQGSNPSNPTKTCSSPLGCHRDIFTSCRDLQAWCSLCMLAGAGWIWWNRSFSQLQHLNSCSSVNIQFRIQTCSSLWTWPNAGLVHKHVLCGCGQVQGLGECWHAVLCARGQLQRLTRWIWWKRYLIGCFWARGLLGIPVDRLACGSMMFFVGVGGHKHLGHLSQTGCEFDECRILILL